jgi:glycine/D-amino acid oxidase-like deaminating enzyme
MLAMELIPVIRERLAQLDAERPGPRNSGRRAALWRAQQHAARIEHTVDDLRRYCLQWLGRQRLLDAQDENDYLRGYREGLQTVLREIRGLEVGR